jgi:hypothetical protein
MKRAKRSKHSLPAAPKEVKRRRPKAIDMSQELSKPGYGTGKGSLPK